MRHSPKPITNNIATITTINNQTAIITATTFTSAENSMTSLGGVIGNVTSTDDFNNLLNEATNHAYQNMQIQTPNLSGFEISQNNQNLPVSSNHQPAQSIPAYPVPKPSTTKQSYTKPHSTTKTASSKQQDLIQKLCNERGKDLGEVLAPYNKSLSEITSAEANEIIQEMKSNN